MIKFGNLYHHINVPHPNGKTKNRSIPVSIDKRGGRLRASMITDHYETYFQTMQLEGNYIPLDFFHSCRYGDKIMKNIIHIHLRQSKYMKMDILEFWSQSEVRKQVEAYYREMKTMQTKRSNDKDLQQIVAWWYDEDIGITARIKRYNTNMFCFVEPFDFIEENIPSLGTKRISHSETTQLQNDVSDDFNLDDVMDYVLQCSENEIIGDVNDDSHCASVVRHSSESMLHEQVMFEYFEV